MNQRQPGDDLAHIRWQPDPIDAIPPAPKRPAGDGELPDPTDLSSTGEISGASIGSFDSVLYWDDPPWGYVDPQAADRIALAVSNEGIRVSGLAVEWSTAAQPSTFLANPRARRMLPYRPEREGLSSDDFSRCEIIDLRLDRAIRADGGYGYDARDLHRWGEIDADELAVSDGVRHGFAFPVELKRVDQLDLKIDQLRRVAPPGTRIFGSVSTHQTLKSLGDVPHAALDGWILRVRRQESETGRWVRCIERWMKRLGQNRPATPLWVSPPAMPPASAVKLLAIGVRAIACDAWCDRILWPDESGRRVSADQAIGRFRTEVLPQLDEIRGRFGRREGRWVMDRVANAK